MGKDLEKLQEENLELRLNALKSMIHSNNEKNREEHAEIIKKIEDVLKHVKETNGNVAKVNERVYKLEKEKSLKVNEIERIKDVINKEREETKLWRTISGNKWVLMLILVFIYILGSNTFRDVVFELISKIR